MIAFKINVGLLQWRIERVSEKRAAHKLQTSKMRIDLRHTRRLLAQEPINHSPFIVVLVLDMLGEAKIKRVAALTDVPIYIVQES